MSRQKQQYLQYRTTTGYAGYDTASQSRAVLWVRDVLYNNLKFQLVEKGIPDLSLIYQSQIQCTLVVVGKKESVLTDQF